MGTKIKSLPQIAGVECPKETGEMEKGVSCKECRHYVKCSLVVMNSMEDPPSD